MALFALGELGGDEVRGAALHHLFFESRHQLVVERGVAEQMPGFKERGADGHVGLRLPDAFADRTRGVADLLPHVPQAIEQRFGDRFAPGGLFVRQHKQQIDVGARRQQATAIAAGGDHRHALGLGMDLRRIKRVDGELEQDADDFVLGLAQPLGAAPPMAVLEQQFLGAGARLRQRRLEAAGDGGAQFTLAAGMGLGKAFEVGDNRRAVEEFGSDARGALSIQHHPPS